MPLAPTVFRARHVATMTPAGLIDDGCVIVDNGRIAAVGRTQDLKPPRIDVDVDGLLTPGLVNAHTHLELTNVPRPATPGTFQDWLLATMAATYDPDPAAFAATRSAATHAGIAQCVRFGVTTVGDVSQNVDVIRPVLGHGPTRSVSFGECLGLGERRQRFRKLYDRALDVSQSSALIEIGVAPHAPYTVDPLDYERVNADRTRDVLVTTHLSETPDEDEFVWHRAGPFAEMYRRLGFDPGPATDAIPTGVLALCSTLNRFLHVHVNYCDDECMDAIRLSGSSVVWCPRTHAYFAHPPHRWRDMRAAGITVCVGTDSCASSPDLNVMDDVRLVRQQCPDESPADLWALVTSAAADALHWPRRADPTRGRLRPGLVADFCVWPTGTDAPLTEVLDTRDMLPSGVWIGGTRVSPL